MNLQESGCAAAQSAFVYAIAGPEGTIGGRYNLFYFIGNGEVSYEIKNGEKVGLC